MARQKIKVIWSKQALDQLHQLFLVIAADKFTAAKQFIKKIQDKAKRLETFPLSGKKNREIDDENIREIVINGYRLIYALKPNRNMIEILAFHSGRQEIPAIH